jgi:DNA polymerase
MDSRQSAILDIMGITRWVPRGVNLANLAEPSLTETINQPVTPAADLGLTTELTSAVPSSAIQIETADWASLETAMGTCTRCDLHQQRTHAVAGAGNRQASWLIIGEAPGEQEDLQGEPFVGRAGVLLNNMLKAVGLDRTAVYIANVVKCRPPGNRDPLPVETEACYPYLQRQIVLLQPDLILLVGRVAAQNLLKTDTAVGRLRGKVHVLANTSIPMIVTYHPAYLLRRPSEKSKTWEDLKLALQTMRSK